MMIKNFSSLDAESPETFRYGLDLVKLFREILTGSAATRAEIVNKEIEDDLVNFLVNFSFLARATKTCVMIWSDFVEYLFLNHAG